MSENPNRETIAKLDARWKVRGGLHASSVTTMAALLAALREDDGAQACVDTLDAYRATCEDETRLRVRQLHDGNAARYELVERRFAEAQRALADLKAADQALAREARGLHDPALVHACQPARALEVWTEENIIASPLGEITSMAVRAAKENKLAIVAAIARGQAEGIPCGPIADLPFVLPILQGFARVGRVPVHPSSAWHAGTLPPIDRPHDFVSWCKTASDASPAPAHLVELAKESFARIAAAVERGARNETDFFKLTPPTVPEHRAHNARVIR
jgi:hypothetical protein